MKLHFIDSLHFLQPVSTRKSACISLKIFDTPLIVWNINTINKVSKINQIYLPEDYTDVFSVVSETFPNIEVKSIPEDLTTLDSSITIKNSELQNLDELRINLNSMVYQPISEDVTVIELIKYPWDYLRCIKNALDNHVSDSKISHSAKIPKTTVLDGPCIIEDNVVIDDFCKIKGPIFIGKDSFIGMGSLVRNCMFGRKTTIGFNCEISKSYFSSPAEIAHHNVILDSVIGENVWFAGYSGTANVLLTKKNVKYQIKDELIDTGISHFGAVIGDNSSVGAAVIILPGRQVAPNSAIQAGTIFGKK